MLGAGRMGGALIEGWLKARTYTPDQLIIRDPFPSPQILELEGQGCRLNPQDGGLALAQTVLLAVKPQIWRETAEAVQAHLAPDAIILSVAAGVSTADLSRSFGGRRVARIMPTTGAAIGQGVASIFTTDATARARAHALFSPVGTVVDLDDESLMHAATGVSGSAPAYFYAFVEALEAAGIEAGLPADSARKLAHATMTGAAALMAERQADPGDLRRQVTSPNGTTEAALKILMGSEGLGPLLRDAVAAATQRSRELGG